MAEATPKTLKVVVVTPERAVLDEAADLVILPMIDGELGVLPGARRSSVGWARANSASRAGPR